MPVACLAFAWHAEVSGLRMIVGPKSSCLGQRSIHCEKRNDMRNRGTNSIIVPEFGYRLPLSSTFRTPLAHQALPKAVDAWFCGTAEHPWSSTN
ncbi:uncharacterized protein BDZ83DRAFT_602358 [Colletotrichum acutatum]|uniref:Uncharacterized protein n=1 Tax=Glomerella acutata TaxID=27357 RepID=A0AAD8XN45_GLOAC|nr:uncharacterized protein BDZ83DRAFT_602358 [Colletotrichum acutatum]KAK1730334.1 hypothetical protein BDZ83DRAFT_602358 [Colletotrichum acutatum]